MGQDTREVRQQVEEAREELGDTVAALAYKVNAPRRAKDRLRWRLAGMTGDALGIVARPAVSGTMRARRPKKEQHSVTAKQWLGYIAVAIATTWLTQKLDDLVDERFAARNGRVF